MLKKNKKTINLLNGINTSINNTPLIKQTQYILISISGGQDSICIFFIFLQLKKQWKWSFGVIYCNHLWQKNTFFASLLVVKLVYMFKIPVYCAITPNKIFNENQSRYWRYDTFYRISFFYDYKIISTGHTSSDKVETVLFQLIRGTSTKSLTSLNFIKYFLSSNNFSKNNRIQTQYLYNYTPFQQIKSHKLFHQNYFFKTLIETTSTSNSLLNSRLLLRPILTLHRFDLKKLVIFWKLPVYPDVSNNKTYYHRNRIRKQLLPTLRFFFNPQIDIIMLQFAEILLTEQIYLDVVTSRLKYEFHIKNKKIGQLNSSLFYGIPLAVQRKLVKKFLETYTQKQAYFLQIEYILKKIISKKKFSFSKFYGNVTKPGFPKTLFLGESKRFKHNYFYPIKLNLSKYNVYQLYLFRYKKQAKKKKISLLKLYFSNRNIYRCLPYKNHFFSKYIQFFKKQFFLSAINKFFCNLNLCNRATLALQAKKRISASCLPKVQIKSKIDFYIYLIFFFLKQENKTSFQFLKSPIKKKNSFNFIQLVKKHTRVKNKSEFSFAQLFFNKFLKSKISHKELLNFFLHTYYFQEFEIFLYPEIGILFYFRKKLVMLNI